MILICTNELAGTTGYHKSVVETANALHRVGLPVTVLSFLGEADGADRVLPRWPLDMGIPVLALQTLPADGGRLLHRNVHPTLSGHVGTMDYSFTPNQLAALRQINDALSVDDVVLFTSPVQAIAFRHALAGGERRPRTVLQIHGDYLHHVELWNALVEARDVIDRLQTVADGLRAQFVPMFEASDVVWIPNLTGEKPSPVERVAHEGVNIALPASYQSRKNQLDAVRALSLIDDESVHLTLWGTINPRNTYYIAVQNLVASLGLERRVQLAGFGEASDIYGTADIVLMTSLSEGFGYPLLEAAHNRLPAVAYDFDFGPRDAIDDGESGFIVPLGDVGALAARLEQLASDPGLRERMGLCAREIFDSRFRTDAVVTRYRDFLGPAAERPVDLVELFSPGTGEPVALDDIRLESTRVGRGTRHRITVRGSASLLDVECDDGKRIVPAKVRRLQGATVVEFRTSGIEVVSYVTEPGSSDRHYLANSTSTGGLEVRPYLRRDATYGDGVPAVSDTVFSASGGSRRLTAGTIPTALHRIARTASQDIAWKVRQVRNSSRPAVAAAPPVPVPSANGPLANDVPGAPAAVQQTASQARAGQGALAPAGAPAGRKSILPGARRLLGSYATSTAAIVASAISQESGPARREIPRHPVFPVTAGVDSFGTPVNQPGGVSVTNSGTVTRPTVSIRGEYDWIDLSDARSTRRVASPVTYGELFDGICEAERDFGLFDRTTSDGVHIWELGRSALVIQLAESLGMWDAAPAVGTPVRDIYAGPKRLVTAPSARRVVFDYTRRGGTDYRTAAFRDDETLFVVQPEPDGYPEADGNEMVYPIHEYNRWRQGRRRRLQHLRTPDVDPRPFEEALSKVLGIPVNLGDHLRNRLLKFRDERDFWTPVFERVQPEEVLIAASHWSAGVSEAAKRAGALVSDIQYAETSRYHATFWFGDTPRHGATRLYAWSDYWAARTNAYAEHVVAPRRQPELLAAIEDAEAEAPEWDVCVISQPRVLRRILAFVADLVRERPELRVVLAPHPVQRLTIDRDLAAAGLKGTVTVSPVDTLTTCRRSAMCVGGYSTSMWEAVAMGRPTFVIPLPGHELTLDDVRSGLFQLATTPGDLVPYAVPETRRSIFGPTP